MGVKLWSRNDQHMLSVQLGTRDGRPTDKQAARALRRFRACDPFVETEYEALQVEGLPELRAFIAKAHAASPDTWGVVKERRPYLRIEAPDEAAVGEERSAEADVRNHVPSPLPEGWSERAARNATPDTAVVLETPYADVSVWLLREDGSDVHLAVRGGSSLVRRTPPSAMRPPWMSSRASMPAGRLPGAVGRPAPAGAGDAAPLRDAAVRRRGDCFEDVRWSRWLAPVA